MPAAETNTVAPGTTSGEGGVAGDGAAPAALVDEVRPQATIGARILARLPFNNG